MALQSHFENRLKQFSLKLFARTVFSKKCFSGLVEPFRFFCTMFRGVFLHHLLVSLYSLWYSFFGGVGCQFTKEKTMKANMSVDELHDLALSGEIAVAIAKFLCLTFDQPEPIDPEFEPDERTFCVPCQQKVATGDIIWAVESYAKEQGFFVSWRDSGVVLSQVGGSSIPRPLVFIVFSNGSDNLRMTMKGAKF
jgi:hypothetical protein